MKKEPNHFEMMQSKHFVSNTEAREAKNHASKDKTSEQIKADLEVFYETERLLEKSTELELNKKQAS